MKLSVIVPGYKTPIWQWERCVHSIAQSLPAEGGEIICVDDGDPAQVALDRLVRDNASLPLRVWSTRNRRQALSRTSL